MRAYDGKIVMEDGSEYLGYRFGSRAERVCEVVFNTSMVGYQEIVSDPSYTDQMVVMTYPLIGNYGTTDEDFETRTPMVGGLIVREYNDSPSNFRYTKTLGEILEENGIPGIEGIDTRKLTRSIRDLGSRKVLICGIDTSHERAMEILSTAVLRRDQVSRVSCAKRWYARTSNHQFNVVAVDCGIKLSAIHCLNIRRCNVTVVPWNTSVEEIAAMNPDGVFFSNGPGDPKDAEPVVQLVRELRGKYPIFGIGLGCQLIARAYGAETVKLPHGHRGSCPVKDLATGRLYATSQSHGFAVDPVSLKNTDLGVTHTNLLDHSVEGVSCDRERVFGIQFHPESAPGPQDCGYLFDQFVEMMKEGKHNA